MSDIVRSDRLVELHRMHPHLLRLVFIACIAAASLTGCHRHYRMNSAEGTEGYRYRTGAAVVGPEKDTLRVAVVVVNESNEQRAILFHTCSLDPVQARVSAGGRNWSTEAYEPNHPAVYSDSPGKPIVVQLCSGLTVMRFPPGHSYMSVLKVPVREILGDSLPGGTYKVTARLVNSGGDGRKLDAGEVYLCRCEVRAINVRPKGKQSADGP